MKMRVAIEVVQILLSVAIVVGLGMLSAWSYRPATDDIWLVTSVAVLVVVVLGVRQLQRAIAEHRTVSGSLAHD
ncbi:hypothetical protein LK533_01445 [Sphingomonas sp. PL-96]|uniref:hypothetical protein n=1 Tax=Sphingomonas sp. PL-96 TaxID=2887201 RepID=UPI001E31F663|nr:hypothetical protein [Sphingomonas sp. PL-96]MCC2975336.1 hypothetical protein [Sphingomonas sp. PL-96]